MAYDKSIEARIDSSIRQRQGIEKKKMFGGVCYLLNGNICFGIWQSYLIVRTDPATAALHLAHEHVRPFDVTGRPMKGWLMVAETAWPDEASLTEWLNLGFDFARKLPEK